MAGVDRRLWDSLTGTVLGCTRSVIASNFSRAEVPVGLEDNSVPVRVVVAGGERLLRWLRWV